MILKEDGVKVIKTDLNKQLSLNGKSETFPVYNISLDCLYFNDQNDRIATWISKYKAENKVDAFDMSDIEEYNKIIEGFIVKSNKDAIEHTQKNIALIGQQEFGVVLKDGRIIDGNRRFTCLRRIQRESSKPRFFKAVILDRDIENDKKEIKKLELALQMGVDRPVDYDPIDRLVGVYQTVVQTKLLTVDEYAQNVDKPKKEIENEIDRAKLMVEFLDFINAPGKYYLVRDMKLYELFNVLNKILKRYGSDEERQKDIKKVVFANFAIRPQGEQTKYIRNINKISDNPRTLDGYIEDQMPAAQKVMNRIEEYPDVDEKILKEKISSDDLRYDFALKTEKWLSKTRSEESRNQPAQLLDKAYNAVDTIDVNIFKKMSADQLGVLEEKTANLLELLELIDDEIKSMDSYGK